MLQNFGKVWVKSRSIHLHIRLWTIHHSSKKKKIIIYKNCSCAIKNHIWFIYRYNIKDCNVLQLKNNNKWSYSSHSDCCSFKSDKVWYLVCVEIWLYGVAGALQHLQRSNTYQQGRNHHRCKNMVPREKEVTCIWITWEYKKCFAATILPK